MQSPVHHSQNAGWTATYGNGIMEAPTTVERKRRGRNLDVMGSIPTPPRSRENTHLPTPVTVRRHGKTADKSHAVQSTTLLPTPQTLPRQRKIDTLSDTQPSEDTTDDAQSPPSPSGHTTFFLTSSSVPRGEKITRRRPGLTFAQQMGLLSQASQQAPASNSGSSGSVVGFGGRLGMGVGMGGGMRNNGHGKVDQVFFGKLEGSAQMRYDEDNPFLAKPTTTAKYATMDIDMDMPPGLASPGKLTFHQLGPMDLDDFGSSSIHARNPSSSPLSSRKPFQSSSPASSTETLLLSQPATTSTQRIKVVSDRPLTLGSKDARLSRDSARKEERERRKRMMDYEDNPFLVKPGEGIRTERAPMIDEERPTVTYVFRGAKKVFANPFLPSAHPFPRANLSPRDEDYEPHPNPAPKLLWPTGPVGSPSSPDMEGESSSSRPITLNSRPVRRRFTRSPTELDDDGDIAMAGGVKSGHTLTPLFTPELELGLSGCDEPVEDEEEDEPRMPVRRGLLFGPGAMGNGDGNKRSSFDRECLDERVEKRGKKNSRL